MVYTSEFSQNMTLLLQFTKAYVSDQDNFIKCPIFD